MRYLLLILAISLISALPAPKLVKTKITDNITMLIPKGFRPMDDLDFAERYPSVRKPIAAYSNYERDVDISVNVSATQWPDQNLEMAQKFFKASIYNMFDNVDMISEGIHEVKGRQYIFFEFESRVKGNPMEMDKQTAVLNYTYLQYLVESKRTIVFSFNCPRRLRQEWQESAGKIMSSIKAK